MPDDVADRMDRVLAGLGDEAPAASPEPRDGPDVVPIAAHRRRRAAGLLVAAAAVVVGGVALSPHLHSEGSSSGSAGSTEANADAGGQSANLGNTGNGPAPQAHLPGAKQAKLHDGRLVVRPLHFASDALQGRALLAHRSAAAFDDHAQTCAEVPEHAQTLPAQYQHAPAALVYRRVEGGSQVVDLYVCGNSRPIRSTTLPAP
jgi:hypothetical protein